uniref:RrF2 family transcriptional regulator n=1 Tax=Candidatus Enterococcus willemsii TaxID=1857215 RepID=UPI00403FBA15
MKLKNSLEEAICILFVLSESIDEKPIKSATISCRLSISDSYMKKTLRKLVIGKLVLSSVSKGGGFKLARSLDEISILDVFYAIEGKDSYVQTSHLIERVYPHEEGKQIEANLLQFLHEGEEVLRNQLRKISLGDLLKSRIDR